MVSFAVGDGSSSSNLLTNPSKNLSFLGTKLVKGMEAKFSDLRASMLATWIACAAGLACKEALSTSTQSVDAASALASLPVDGAMRPLVEKFMELVNKLPDSEKNMKGETGEDVQAIVETLCSILRCLTEAKRLPLMNWGVVCHQILAVCGVHKFSLLEAECGGLCLAHARTPSLGLREVLEWFVMGNTFDQLSTQTKVSSTERVCIDSMVGEDSDLWLGQTD